MVISSSDFLSGGFSLGNSSFESSKREIALQENSGDQMASAA